MNKYLHIYEDNFERRYLEMIAGALRIFYIDLSQSQFQFSTNTYVLQNRKNCISISNQNLKLLLN